MFTFYCTKSDFMKWESIEWTSLWSLLYNFSRLGQGLGGTSELVCLIEVANEGKIAAQAARAVRVAETVTGVLSALFVAVDVFFIFLDSR